MESSVGTNSSGASAPNVGQQVVDEHLRNLRHYVPDERVDAWSQQRYEAARRDAEARVLRGRLRAEANERRQAEISRDLKEKKLFLSRQKILFKEQKEREAKERRAAERTAQLERIHSAEMSERYIPNSVPPPPPLPFNTMPDICVWFEQHSTGPVVYYDFARTEDARVMFRPRKP